MIKFNCIFILFLTLASFANAELRDQILLQEQNAQQDRYRLALGVYENINARWQNERELVFAAQVRRQTYELQAKFQGIDEAWPYLERDLGLPSATTLFKCRDLECGSSNAWANTHFGVKQLYGLDQAQRYLAMKTLTPDWPYRVIYISQRGNKRIYLHIEDVRPAETLGEIAPSVSTILSELNANGWYAIPATKSGYELDSEQLNSIVELIAQKPFMRLYLVGHSNKGKGFEQRQEDSLNLVNAVHAQLNARGAKVDRVATIGLGDSAPRRDQAPRRVEVVLAK